MNSLKRRSIARLFLAVLLVQLVTPYTSMALTTGPSQPEVQTFQPAGTTDMVDLFTGDFSYNIPLFELPGPNGGYPFNLAYQAGITMDQEASWVGLGWNLQPGAINRQVRGLPDEFKGDPISTKMSVAPSVTVGLGAGAGVEIFGGDALSLGVGFSVYNNNYKGYGYSIDATLGFSAATKSGMTGGLSLGLSLDSKEGVGVNPSLNLGDEAGEFGLGAGYNSKQGLTSVTLSQTMTGTRKGFGKNDKILTSAISSSSATLSLANPGYTPQISMPMKSINLSATFKAGAAWWGAFAAPYVSGFYNEQWLDKDKAWVSAGGYGFLNYQHKQSESDILDFNREKDGMVGKETPNLGLANMTYDIYSVSGQGIGFSWRPFRNDYGVVEDQKVSSNSNSVGLGVDVGPAASHIGANLTVNHAKSTSEKWSSDNDLSGAAQFQKKSVNSGFEPTYLKVHGESTSESVSKLNAMGGEKAMRVKLSGDNNSVKATAFLEGAGGTTVPVPAASTSQARPSRNQIVQPITNAELMSGASEIMPELNISYYDSLGVLKKFVRPGTGTVAKNHVAAYTVLNSEGVRYVYGLPAYNVAQEEVTYSSAYQPGSANLVDVEDGGNGDPKYNYTGTDKFLKRVSLPKYAHSHLLTSILGPDYVDLTNDGVTPDDLGYWVKFTYKKAAAAYKWREPYSKAYAQHGWRTDPRDDKGSFVYGAKEVWYLAKAETRSHVADFTVEARKDGMGVNTKLQNTNLTGKEVYSLKQITLYSRLAGPSSPIKVTKFDYDYSLCPNTFNNDGTSLFDPSAPTVNKNLNKGKLTLKKVWFEYGASSRGKLNPYVFTYHSNNPSYDVLAFDRWGVYKPYPVGQPYFNQDFPYSEQDPSKETQIDANVAAWSLKEIELPSGGKIVVDYESDDYGYVQNKVAMQMTPMVDPYTSPTGSLLSLFQLSQTDYKVRFKLESSIAGTLNGTEQTNEVLKYLDTKTWQLYFKVLVNLRKSGEGFFEYISGYVDINRAGAMTLEKDATGKYVYGTFYVKDEGSKNPFSVRAWQHLRTNQPDLANSDKKLSQTSSNSERINQIKSLGSIGAQIRQMFKGFNNYCDGNQWGKEVDATKSWIRLNSPDRVKYGGGLRVRQITMKDQWAQDDEGVYGQIYEYTTKEGTQTISSGVAAFEPIQGGDENALRYAKPYSMTVRMRSSNNLFFEYPVNESNYPGPQVGYSKVSVLSLPSASRAGKPLTEGQTTFPQGVAFGSTGMTVHEFYTAKDFPVITEETEKINKPYKLSVPVPLLGNISVVKLTSSQGYSIITNDMHGKKAAVRNYRQAGDGTIEKDAMSWVEYTYLTQRKTVNGTNILALNNTLKDNGDGTLMVPSSGDLSNPSILYNLGQESEMTFDMRQYQDDAWSGGARLNTDILYIPIIFAIIPIPAPTVWPNVSKSTTQLRLASTNKVIFKTGILQKVEAFDGGSRVKTTNLKWDKQTGQVVLTSVNNDFDDLVYNYTRPAFREYQGMGAAYQNSGLTFDVNFVQKHPTKNELYFFQHSLAAGLLMPGDEILLYASNTFESPIARVLYKGEYEEDDILYTEQPLTATAYKGLIIRSGYRNQLSVEAEKITALQDPSVKGSTVTYSKTISMPKQ